MPARRFRPLLAALEDRAVPATLTVNTTADDTTADPVLTLREAVTLVNAGTTDPASNGLGRALTAGESGQVAGTLGADDRIRFESAPGVALGGTITVVEVQLPAVARAVAVEGPGAKTLTVS